jgi:uncharacterized membrane protein
MIGAICQYCVASAALMVASLVLAVLRARSEPSGGARA